MGYEYIPYAGSEGGQEHRIWFHSYLFREPHDLENAIVSRYGQNVDLKSKLVAFSVQRGLKWHEKNSDEEGAIEHRSEKGLHSKKGKWKLSPFMPMATKILEDG